MKLANVAMILILNSRIIHWLLTNDLLVNTYNITLLNERYR